MRKVNKDSKILFIKDFICVSTRIKNDINGNSRFSVDFYTSYGDLLGCVNFQAYEYYDLKESLERYIKRFY